MRYGIDGREVQYGKTQVINVSERYVLDLPDREFSEKDRYRVIWKNGAPEIREQEE